MYRNPDYDALPKAERRGRLREIALVFMRLGALAFGGPAAHIAMMEEAVVQRRAWLPRQKFMDLLGATNLIPGPNSTEMAILLGFERGGYAGLFLAGAAFILPAVFIVSIFAFLYVRFGALPQVAGALVGVKPVIMAVVLQALLRLGKSAVKGALTAAVGVAVIALTFLGVEEILLLLCAGAITTAVMNWPRIRNRLFSLPLPMLALLVQPPAPARDAGPVSMALSSIFLTFFKIGAVLYGSGYVLLAYLDAKFVARFGVITTQQLMDAVAVGQVTPGPVFTTATFIGYLIHGLPGGLAATAGIFLPSFLLVLLINPIIPRLRKSPWVGAALDGVNVASLGIMAVVTVRLGVASLIDPFTVALFVVAAVLLLRYKVNSAWLILGGGLLGYAYTALM